jgi:uncharacterized protein YjbJ (UPF0337 family)
MAARLEIHQPYPAGTRMERAVPAPCGRTTMKSGTKDKVEGKYHEAKGKVKEVAGKISGKPDLEVAGTDEEVAGKIQGKVGQIKTVLGK